MTKMEMPEAKSLAAALRSGGSGGVRERVRTAVEEGLGGLGGALEESLQKLLFGGNGTETRLINWKIVNHGKQTIIIL